MHSPVLSDDSVAMGEVFGLLVECPLCRGNPSDCQLHEIRKLTLQERYVWAKDMPFPEVARIQRRCALCAHCRKAGVSPVPPQPAPATVGSSGCAS